MLFEVRVLVIDFRVCAFVLAFFFVGCLIPFTRHFILEAIIAAAFHFVVAYVSDLFASLADISGAAPAIGAALMTITILVSFTFLCAFVKF